MIERASNLARAALGAWLLVLVGCERAELLGTLVPGGVPGGPVAPHLVPGLSDPLARDTDPTFTGDLLELYFMSDRSGSKDIWRARRTRASLPWGSPEPVEALSTGYQEENPHVANDGLTLWFFTDRDRELGSIWQTTRASVGDAWEEPTAVSEFTVGSGSSVVEAGIDESGTLAVLCARPGGAASYDLYVSERATPTGSFEEPTLIENVNSSEDDYDGTFAQGGLFIAFHANRFGTPDIFYATRASTSDPFDPPLQMDQVNTDEHEESAPAISSDLRYVMFSSSREGSLDIYEAVLAP